SAPAVLLAIKEMVQRTREREGGGPVPLLPRRLLLSQPLQEAGPPQVIRPGLKPQLAGTVQDLKRLPGRTLLSPDAGEHDQQGVTVGGHCALPSGGKVLGERQRLQSGQLGPFQVGGRLPAEEKRPFVGSEQPAEERLVAMTCELLVLLQGAMSGQLVCG